MEEARSVVQKAIDDIQRLALLALRRDWTRAARIRQYARRPGRVRPQVLSLDAPHLPPLSCRSSPLD